MNTAKEIGQDPAGFARGELLASLKNTLQKFLIADILITVLFFLLGYTSVLGGPWSLARVLFWIAVIISLFMWIWIGTLYKMVKPLLKKTRQQVKAQIIEDQ